jgi:hypothetical protein
MKTIDLHICARCAQEFLEQIDVHPKQVQTSGPKCKCGAFTTYKRVETHGLCMKCEEAKK